MQIQKRKFSTYVLLNCLTLGIYGLVVNQQIGDEINALCKGDGEQPAFGYAGAVLIRSIPTFFGLIFGLIIGVIAGSGSLNIFGWLSFLSAIGSFLSGIPLIGGWVFTIVSNLLSSIPLVGGWLSSILAGGPVPPLPVSFPGISQAFVVFSCILVFGVLFTWLGSAVSSLYLNYWWYKQANRLSLNAHRFDLVVKERGADVFLFRTVINLLFVPITVIIFSLSMLLPLTIAWLITLANSAGAFLAAVVILTICAIPLMLFGCELTTGSLFSFFFITKNINRYSNIYRNGARPFEPMGYEYYPSINNHSIKSLPKIVDGSAFDYPVIPDYSGSQGGGTIAITSGSIAGLSGTCAGYHFDLAAGEEIIIGKDANASSIIIESAYKEISRKHVGISYDTNRGVYLVRDYSSNGTWANGQKLQPGIETIQQHGTVLQLANEKNTFRLD
ncbi:MAG: FHA domain-containing protein [Oscillospiraceae bacterium]|nr:FHA domain-containing protein [Oscillospiraceae bacterium]